MKIKSRSQRLSIIKSNKTCKTVSVFAASSWILAFIFWNYSVTDSHPKSSSKVVSPHVVVEMPASSVLDDLRPDEVVVEMPASSVLDDLQPDDGKDQLLFESLHSCVNPCQPLGVPSHKVAILVPPGSMGSLFVDFCKRVINFYVKDDEDFEVVVTSRLASHKDEFTHIIRFATLPMLLSVGDALLAVGPAAEATVQDVVEITELLIWWHCEMSYLADQQSTPVHLATMQYLMEDPEELKTDLLFFISALDPDESESNDIPVDKMMMNSVSQVTEVIQHLIQRLDKDPSQQAQEKGGLKVMVNDIMADLLPKCAIGLPAPLSLEGEMAKRVYSLMNMELSDEAICGDSRNPLSRQLACKERVPPFMAKQLMKSK